MKYTQENSTFTMDQRMFYERNGFIVIRNNVDPVFLDKLCRRFIDICEGKADDYSAHIVKDPFLEKKGASGQYIVNKIDDFFYDEVFWEYPINKAVVDVVEQIIGPNITAGYSMIINKPPNSDPNISRHPLHQDLQYSPSRPANRCVTSWTAMERVDEKNGCLYVVPGTHKGPLYKHDYPETGGRLAVYHEIKGMGHLPKLHIIMEKGDTIFFHPLLLHGSGPNLTQIKKSREETSLAKANMKTDSLEILSLISLGISANLNRKILRKATTFSEEQLYYSQEKQLDYDLVQQFNNLEELREKRERDGLQNVERNVFGFRKALSCHYADSNCDLIDLTNTINGKMAKQFEDIFEKRTGERMSFANMMRAKCRLVRGSPGNLQRWDSNL